MLENVIIQIDEQIAELQEARALLTGGVTASVSGGIPAGTAKAATAPTPKKRRKMTAADRKAIGEAQKKRWAAIKATKKAK
jgi:hypothetical protein